MMDFRILGPLEVRRELAVIPLSGAKQRAVLAMLLLRANEPVSAEQLAQALWGDEAAAGAVRTVQVHVSRLRKALGDADIVTTTPAGYRLRVQPGELDADRFERLVEDGRRALRDGRPDEAAGVLREALTLWRGPPLADLAFERFAQRDIARLEEQKLAAIEVRMEAGLAAGRHAELVADLRRLVDEHPTSERLAGQLMLALYRSGRQAEALDAYHDARRKLADEIGIELGPELRDLQEAVLRHDPSLRLRPPPGDLPRELDPVAAPELVGRDDELAWLRARWHEARTGAGELLALAGPHGIGKTRLAAELAQEAHHDGAMVLYASGAAAIGALGGGHDTRRPVLVVADDADGAGDGTLAAVRALARGSRLVLATAEELETLDALQPNGALTLKRLDAEAVRAIALTYDRDHPAEDIPAKALLDASAGVPRRVHDVARKWARNEAARRVEALAGPAAAGRAELRSMEDELAGGIVQLQTTRELVHAADEDERRVVCPFKGLASFEADDAPYFFGRERLIAELVARLVGAPLLGVVGPSGSGKSSVVKAGLLPALAGGVLPGSERWPPVVIRPGEHPLRELRGGLDGVAARRRVVLAVDQFEETFTACRDEEERAEFLSELARVSRDRPASLVIVAIRADFYGRCAAYPELSRLLAANHVLVGSLSREELRQAVVCPAQRVGLYVEPELADALVNDVADEPGALPLLSSALLELWHRRDGRRLRAASYEETGGVRGAVARLAEDAFGRLDDSQQAIARGLLLRLAVIDDDGSVERRRLPLDELDAEEGAVADVIGLLADSRLLTVSEGSVEVAHEALLREWPRLRAWIDEDRDGLRIRRSLTVAAEEWRELGYDEDMLFRGLRLTEADEWREGHELSLNQLERTFLDASDAGRETEQKARRRRVRRAFAGLAVALAAITAVAIVALYQGREADRQRDIAASRELAARATSVLDVDPSLSLALAQRALERRDTEQAGNVLRQATLASRTLSVWPAHSDWVHVVEPSRDGRQALTAGRDGVVRIQDLGGDPRVWSVRAHPGAWVLGASLSPDGREVASAGDDGIVAIWDVASRRKRVLLRLGQDYATGVEFSSDGRRLIVPLLDGTVRVVRATDGGTVSVLRGHEGAVWAAGFSPDGTRAVSTDDGSARIWDLAGGPPIVLDHPEIVIGADFSPDGRRVATAADDGVVRVWDAARGNLLVSIRADDQHVNSVRFSGDGRRLVTAGADGVVRVWDSRGGPALSELRGHRGAAIAAAFVPGTDTVVSGGEDGTLRHWAPAADAVTEAPATGASFTPDDRRVVSGGWDGAIRIWDVASGLVRSRRGHLAPSVAEFSPEGERIVSASEDQTARIWDAGSRASDVVYTGRHPLFAAAFDPSGERIAIAGGFERIVVQRPDGADRIVLRGHRGVVRDVAFSPDGAHLASASDDGTVRLWNAANGTLERTLRGHRESVASVSYSSDGARVVSAGADGTVRIWAVGDERSVIVSGHEGRVSSADFDPSGDRVVSAGQDGTVRVWSAAGGETLVVLYSYQGPAYAAQFSADGRRVVSAGEPGVVRVSVCEVCGSLGAVLRLAQTRAQRQLNSVEQEQLLPRDE